MFLLLVLFYEQPGNTTFQRPVNANTCFTAGEETDFKKIITK
jgi:hypothetical protein